MNRYSIRLNCNSNENLFANEKSRRDLANVHKEIDRKHFSGFALASHLPRKVSPIKKSLLTPNRLSPSGEAFNKLWQTFFPPTQKVNMSDTMSYLSLL